MATAIYEKSNKVKLTEVQKLRIKVGKELVKIAMGKENDVVTLRTYANIVFDTVNTITQEGDKKGKRFSDAKSHGMTDQIAALDKIVTSGNVPTVTD